MGSEEQREAANWLMTISMHHHRELRAQCDSMVAAPCGANGEAAQSGTGGGAGNEGHHGEGSCSDSHEGESSESSSKRCKK